jgi:hypothetical protein
METAMRMTTLTFGLALITAPAFAQSVTINEANPGAAAHAERGAQVQNNVAHHDDRAAANAEHAAHVDAAHGNYYAAAHAQTAAHRDLAAGHQHEVAGHHDAAVANHDSTTTITVHP